MPTRFQAALEHRTRGQRVPTLLLLLYAQFKAIDGQWRQVEIDPKLDARTANLEPRFRAGEMPEAVSLDDKPLSKIWGYDSPVVAPQYEYINLKLRY